MGGGVPPARTDASHGFKCPLGGADRDSASAPNTRERHVRGNRVLMRGTSIRDRRVVAISSAPLGAPRSLRRSDRNRHAESSGGKDEEHSSTAPPMLVNLDESVLQVVDGVAEREQGDRQDQVGEVAGGVGHELLSSEMAGVHGNVQGVAHGTCRVVEELDELVLVAPTERLWIQVQEPAFHVTAEVTR